MGWGSTYGAIVEALDRLDRNDTAYLYVSQPYPLTENIKEYCAAAEQIICVENNATAQFATLLRSTFGIEADRTILKYDGMPFSVEDLEKRLKEVL